MEAALEGANMLGFLGKGIQGGCSWGRNRKSTTTYLKTPYLLFGRGGPFDSPQNRRNEEEGLARRRVSFSKFAADNVTANQPSASSAILTTFCFSICGMIYLILARMGLDQNGYILANSQPFLR